MNNFTQAHVLSCQTPSLIKGWLGSREGRLDGLHTSSAARSPSEEFAKTHVRLNGLQTSQHLRQQW